MSPEITSFSGWQMRCGVKCEEGVRHTHKNICIYVTMNFKKIYFASSTEILRNVINKRLIDINSQNNMT